MDSKRINSLVRQRSVQIAFLLVLLASVWIWRAPNMGLYGHRPNTNISSGSTHDSSATIVSAPPLRPQGNEIDLSHADSPFIEWPLARVCNETKWMPGLVFVCDQNSGGVGNIRSFILTCFRYGIAAGAMAFTMPRIRMRSATDLTNLMTDYRDFDYMFDPDHFKKSITGACPKITIYDRLDEIPNVKHPVEPELFGPRMFGDREKCHGGDLDRTTDIFDLHFHTWLHNSAVENELPSLSIQTPRIVRINWGVQFLWPAARDGPEFANTYGSVLRFHPSILGLGLRTAELMRKFAAAADPEGKREVYAGFHLRTESDAIKGWPDFEEQSSTYLAKATEFQLRAGYLATGNQTEADKFVHTAATTHNMSVTNKRGLLKDNPDDLALLDSLTWDQRGLIDFIVLLESEYFLGVNPSSFSMTVALKRHLKLEGLYTRPWKIGGLGDSRSWIIGRFDSYWENWLMFYDALWP